MPVFNIHHITRYEYDRPIKESVNEVRIFPYACKEQEALYHQLNISGAPAVFTVKDYWGNQIGSFNLMPSHKELVIESKLIVRTLGHPPASDSTMTMDDLRKEVSGNLNLLELAHQAEIELREQLLKEVGMFHTDALTVAEAISSCCEYVFKNFKYIKGITTIETTVKEILELRSGVCQDFAHVMLELLRAMGIPSRYVSGYICPNKNGMRGEGATHAWVEAWIPGMGWAGSDPTNNVWVNDTHVKLAVGRNFNDCSPVKGTFKGLARQSLSVYVSVGYEDGQTIEEMNAVKMLELAGADELPEYVEGFAAQQQQ